MPPELVDDVVVEILLRLPPDDPACLLRASLTSKRWRSILADPAFRRRHRALHRAPSVVGFLRIVSGGFPYCTRFVANNPASGRPASRDLPGWLVLDCRHGRALFVTPPAQVPATEGALDFVVWDPLTDERHRLPPPPPSPRPRNLALFNAAVLCSAAAAGGCNHRGCHGGPFRVAYVFTTWTSSTDCITSARVYSSGTDDWSEPISVQHPHVFLDQSPSPSALVGDTLYFRGCHMYAIEYQLGAQRLSVIDQPPWSIYKGTLIFLVSPEGSGLGFADVEEEPSLSVCLWSRETSPDGVTQWVRGKSIELEMLLPYGTLPPPRLDSSCVIRDAEVVGFAEDTDVIFVSAHTWI